MSKRPVKVATKDFNEALDERLATLVKCFPGNVKVKKAVASVAKEEKQKPYFRDLDPFQANSRPSGGVDRNK